MPFKINPFTGKPDFYESGSAGTVTNVSGTLNRITVTNGTTTPVIDIAATYVGQTSITTVGTIATGTWQGTAIGPVYGGTGLSSYTTGDTLYASASNVLSKLAIGSTSQVLTVVGGIPAWANPASSMIVTTYTSGSGNWTANASTKYVRLYMWGGGAGGGSGRKGTSGSSSSGAGGGAGQLIFSEGPVSMFSGTVAYSIGASANGGTAITTNATNGNPGTAGNNTTFGSLVALGGNAGSGGTASGPSGSAARNVIGLWSTNNSFGGGSAGSLTAGNAASSRGGSSTIFASPTGGSSGGGGDSGTPRSGGNGPGLLDTTNSVVLAGAAGGVPGGTINGANGPTTQTPGFFFSGMGGAGGAGAVNSAAGAGGNGSAPGGGGGSGGGGIDSVGDSGAGGAGAAGQIIILEFL